MPWRRRAWRARAIAWAGRRLRERGLAITGEAEQFHIRPWSTVIRLPTERGRVFFKATWPPQRFEAGLTAAITKWAPDDVGRTLAIDAKRGWLLLEDAGPRLRQTITKDRDIRHWHRVLPQYAELQIAMSSHIRQALKLGTPDRRAPALASQYARLLDEPFLLRVGLKEGLTKAQDMTIQHDDLHDGQIFLRDGHYRILDWGDACVSHPFLSMSVVERSVAYTLRLEPGSREISRLRDLYLEPFTGSASGPRLRAIYPIAIRLGWISRALSWAALVRYLSAREKRKERGDVPRSLGRFLDPTR